METLYPASHTFNSNWLMQECKSTIWTKEENKKFESALAFFDKDTPDRWIKVANMIPGKSVLDVIEHYKELVADISDIEAGVVPLPEYLTSSFTLELVKNCEFNAFRKRPSAYRSSDQEKKKGVPWTEDEHSLPRRIFDCKVYSRGEKNWKCEAKVNDKRFLTGLQKYGKGDWRNISRNFVITKTSTQVASHAQKYYLRQLSERKEKRRPSIHDITTAHLTDANQSDDKSTLLPQPEKSIIPPKMFLDWNRSDDKSLMAFSSARDNPLMAFPHEISWHGLKQKGGGHGADIGLLNLGFQFQPTRYQIW